MVRPAQAMRGSVAFTVQRCELNRYINGREACKELERLHGGREIDERPVQMLPVEENCRLRYLTRRTPEFLLQLQ